MQAPFCARTRRTAWTARRLSWALFPWFVPRCWLGPPQRTAGLIAASGISGGRAEGGPSYATQLKQFHVAHTDMFIAYMGQYVRAMINAVAAKYGRGGKRGQAGDRTDDS